MSGAQRVVVMYAKRPDPGRVKSRLAKELGEGEAARFYARMLDRLVARFDRGAVAHGFGFQLHVDPADAVAWFERRYPTMRGRVIAQSAEADLGARMMGSFEAAFARGFTQVALTCSDAPDLAPEHAARAFSMLLHHDAVFGPARDGGYYLVAWKRPLPILLSGMTWSRPDVWEQTRRRATAARLDLGLLPPLDDVDTGEDWRRLSAAARHDLLPPRRGAGVA